MTINSFRIIHARNSQIRLMAALGLIMFATLDAPAQSRRQIFVPGQRALVFDERLSALRARPDIKSQIKQRLRRGRQVGILGSSAAREGAKFFRVAVSRNTRGWVLADALIRPGNGADAERLMGLIEETKDEFTKARLSKLCADLFPGLAPKALVILGGAAEKAAERLSRDARRRAVDDETDTGQSTGLTRRDFLLNYVGLDRYNRIGVTFDYDPSSDRIVYDGGAYRELLRRFPGSVEVKVARGRLDKLKGQ